MPKQSFQPLFYRRAALRRARRGAALIEFAMVVPVLVFLILGIMEFGWYAKNQLTVANAAREGARMASLGKPVEEIENRVEASAAPIRINSISMECSNNSGGSYRALGNRTIASGTYNDADPGDLIRITARAAHTSLTSLSLFGREIRVPVLMVRERSQ